MKSKIALVVLLTAALAAGAYLAFQTRTPALPRSAFVLPTPIDLPAFSLVDQSSSPVTAETFRGQWHLLFFGFTNCPDICPVTMQILASARRQLEDAGENPAPRIVLVSVDPERDTPERMGRYVDHFGSGNLGVTGDLAELTKLTSSIGIYFEKQVEVDGAYAVDHSAAVLLVNPAAQFHALFSAPHIIADYVHDLAIIMNDVQGPPLVAANVEVMEPLPGMGMSAGYLTLSNRSSESIRISRVNSDQYGSIEIHETTMLDGVAKMRRLPDLEIPAHSTVTLERGGKHLMMLRPTSDDDAVSIRFFSSDTLLLNIDTTIKRSRR